MVNTTDNKVLEELKWTHNPLFFYNNTLIYEIFECEVSLK